MALTRSEQMSRIRSSDTSPERRLRSALWQARLRFRLRVKTPFGRPDITFPSAKLAIFIDGCFWHGCPEHYVRPRTRQEFWAFKLRSNVERDRRQTSQLEDGGWKVCRFWEHEIFESLPEAVELIHCTLKTAAWHPPASFRVVQADPLPGKEGVERRILEELRGMLPARIVEIKRTTRKWKSPNDP